jgi:hypothetical protein
MQRVSEVNFFGLSHLKEEVKVCHIPSKPIVGLQFCDVVKNWIEEDFGRHGRLSLKTEQKVVKKELSNDLIIKIGQHRVD